MSSKKDYERAAKLIRERCENDHHGVTSIVIELAGARRPCLVRSCMVRGECTITLLEDAFVEFFRDDASFDEKRFREACLPLCDALGKDDKSCARPNNHQGKHRYT